MLRIRNPQMEAFRKASIEGANRKLASYARARFPAVLESTSDEQALEIAARVRHTAGTYGVIREDNVATFLDLHFMYGENFHQEPWANFTLASPNLHGPDKIAMLRHLVSEAGGNL